MIRSKRYIINASVVLIVFLFCGVLNAVFENRLALINFTTLCYGVLTLLWAESIHQCVVDRSVNHLLFGISICLLSYIITRHASTVYFTGAERIRRYLWYYESIPITLIPLLSFFASMEMKVTDTEHRQRNAAWDILYIPEILLGLLFLTNDRHGLLYSFPHGIENWETSHEVGILYYVAAVWIVLFVALMLIGLVRYSRVTESVRLLWIPFVPVLLGIIYSLLYAKGTYDGVFSRFLYDPSEVSALLVIGLWEGCIAMGLVSTDVNYIEILAKTDVMAGIADKNGRLIYRNMHYPALPVEMLESMTEKPIMWNDDTRLTARCISGGYVVWNEDISNVNVLSARLDELRDSLQDEKLLIERQNALRERRSRAVEQERLYQMVSESVTPQLKKLEDFLSGLDVNAPDIRERIAAAGVYQAYVKRRCNLTLLAANTETLSTFELLNSIHESMELLRMNGIVCGLIADDTEYISSRAALTLYNLFELTVETLMPRMTALLVNLSSKDGSLFFKLSADAEYTEGDKLASAMKEMHAEVTVEDGTVFVNAVLEGGTCRDL